MEYDERADALDADADRLEREGKEIDKRIEDTRSDWRSKQGDVSVPGAVEGPDEPDDDDASDGEA